MINQLGLVLDYSIFPGLVMASAPYLTEVKLMVEDKIISSKPIPHRSGWRRTDKKGLP